MAKRSQTKARAKPDKEGGRRKGKADTSMFGFISAGRDARFSVVVFVSWQLGLGKLERGVSIVRETRRRKLNREAEGVPGIKAKREAKVGDVNEDEAQMAGGETLADADGSLVPYDSDEEVDAQPPKKPVIRAPTKSPQKQAPSTSG
ncbi:hypothetical protein K438DRAFT_1779319 [Mycena galopus ATCC 62051]|nr:hypothetical protein K438DRAFT_1779319 [Mycena galopus ATCC 62051]